jgi:hypothetical protein
MLAAFVLALSAKNVETTAINSHHFMLESAKGIADLTE